MKTIKFRAWNTFENKMYSAEELDNHIAGKCFMGILDSKIHQFRSNIEEIEIQLNLKPMQFTGAIDKNGKEIYDGDICSDLDGYPMVVMPTETIFLVKGVDGKRTYMLSDDRMKMLEVTGNIYENPPIKA